MLQKLKVWIAAGTSLLAFSAPALMAGTSGPAGGGSAQSDDIMNAESGQRALLDTMVKKGLITDQEAEEIGLKMQEDDVQSSAYKLNLAASIKRLTLFGDMRLRYEIRDGQQPVGAKIAGSATTATTTDTEDRDRARYRIRLGARFDLTDDWFTVVRLDTGTINPRSGNVTYGQESSNGLGYASNGPFGKGNAEVGIGLGYVGWKATDYLTLEIGRMVNPFYTTSMVWDPNLPIDGVAEIFSKKINDHIEVFANATQGLYVDSSIDGAVNSSNTTTTSSYSDIYQFGEQVGVNVKFTDDVTGKLAASVFTYSGSQTTSPAALAANQTQPQGGFWGPFNGDFSDNVTVGTIIGNNYGINNLTMIEVPGELDFKAGKMPMRLFEDFEINPDADKRADLAMHHGRGDSDGYAYQVGIQVNKAKKKGDWESTAFWQRTGTYAVDPNLNDADIFDGRTNMQGFVIGGTYNFTDAISGTLRYANANRIDNSVGTDGIQMGTPGTAQDLSLAAIDHYQLVQADLNWKF